MGLFDTTPLAETLANRFGPVWTVLGDLDTVAQWQRSSALGLCVLLSCLVACGDDDGSANQNNAPTCGNEIVEVGEQCDEGSQNSDTAPNACRTTCHLPSCGDGVIDTDDECEGLNFAGATCQTLGFTRGALACNACAVDTSGCSLCGNGVAEGTDATQVNYEPCDGMDLRGQTCETLGLDPGELACTEGCGVDTSGCGATFPTCGNNVAETGEICDGTDLGGNDCSTIGLPYGVLACSPICTFDISACYATAPVCGNGIVEQGEDCDDGNNDTTDDCPDGPAGTCLSARCGDGFVWAGHEECDDGNEMNGDLCPDGVDGTCELAVCGDGHVWLGEETCEPSLDPTCHADCLTWCGDGIVQPQYGEECDDDVSCHPDCSGWCSDEIVQAAWEACDYMLDVECNVDCTATVCGDGFCGLGDVRVDCVQDCFCGNGTCDNYEAYSSHISGTEDHYNCPQDCPTLCGDGTCQAMAGENYMTCPFDCCSNGGCADGCIIITSMDLGVQNCGSCGTDCGPTQLCVNGECA
jgi:cysteine-rich repeat protein